MYCHLKFKSEYSICSSTNRIKQFVAFAQKSGMRSLAICDDANLFGSLEFANACVSYGIKPIIGVEMKLFNTDAVSVGSVSFFAKTELGYQNVLKITNAPEGIDNSGTVLPNTVRQYCDDIIAISPSIDALKALCEILPHGSFFAEISRFTNEESEIREEATLVEFASGN